MDRVFHGLTEGLDVDGGVPLHGIDMSDRGQGKISQEGKGPKGGTRIHVREKLHPSVGQGDIFWPQKSNSPEVCIRWTRVVYATAQWRKLTVVTGDQHFEGLPGVEMI